MMKMTSYTTATLTRAGAVILMAGIAPWVHARPIPAFPGAEGYGSVTRGGRGGEVIAVTNLNDSGPGSLREAVDARGPRIVVFRVSGTIRLQSPLRILHPHITIAGQTAPGDGIALRDQPLTVGADEVIVRHIRVRLGDVARVNADAISARYNKNIILDHVSASWGTDEVMTLYHNSHVTIQHCIISEAIGNGETHKFAAIWGDNYSTYHHNLIAHNDSRNPRFASGSGHVDFRNNVIYNWGYNSAYGGEKQQQRNPKFDFTTVNMVANYYKPGPATRANVRNRIVGPSTRDGAADLGKWWVSDNIVEGSPEVTVDNWLGVELSRADVVEKLSLGSEYRLAEPWPAMPFAQQSAAEAYDTVLAGAGASLPRRDAVDARIVEDVRRGTATYGKSGIISTQSDVGGWPELKSLPAPKDSDGDGMPDWWEVKYGLDPLDPSDARGDLNGSGYTNIEEYLNGTDPKVFVDYTKPENNVSTLNPAALGTCATVAAAGEKAAQPLRFVASEDGSFAFDTGVLEGVLRQEGRASGLVSVTANGSAISGGSSGLFNHYRVFTRGTRYGDGARSWPSSAELHPDGSVEVVWPEAPDRPFELRATYRFVAANAIDLVTTIQARQKLEAFEVWLASYFGPTFNDSRVWASRDPRGGTTAGFVSAEPQLGDWLAFPRDERAVAVIEDGRWTLGRSPLTWTMMPDYARPLAIRRDASTGITGVVLGRPGDCFGVFTPHRERKHMSNYLSLFGRDIEAGETASARSRLVVLSNATEKEILEIADEFLAVSP